MTAMDHLEAKRPLVSVITITRDNAEGLRRTLESIAGQSWQAVEVIVVDGASNDSTGEVIAFFKAKITKWVSEPDFGIYDAMNKGIRMAHGEWLIFMNSGDCFDAPDSLSMAMACARLDVEVIYSDAYFGVEKDLAACSHDRMRVIHQAVVYRRVLHERHGPYLCVGGVSISDYLFFMAIRKHRWVKSQAVIAHCEGGGISATPRSYYQKLAVDLMAGYRGPMTTGLMLIAYPIYRVVVRPIVRLVRPKRI